MESRQAQDIILLMGMQPATMVTAGQVSPVVNLSMQPSLVMWLKGGLCRAQQEVHLAMPDHTAVQASVPRMLLPRVLCLMRRARAIMLVLVIMQVDPELIPIHLVLLWAHRPTVPQLLS